MSTSQNPSPISALSTLAGFHTTSYNSRKSYDGKVSVQDPRDRVNAKLMLTKWNENLTLNLLSNMPTANIEASSYNMEDSEIPVEHTSGTLEGIYSSAACDAASKVTATAVYQAGVTLYLLLPESSVAANYIIETHTLLLEKFNLSTQQYYPEGRHIVLVQSLQKVSKNGVPHLMLTVTTTKEIKPACPINDSSTFEVLASSSPEGGTMIVGKDYSSGWVANNTQITRRGIRLTGTVLASIIKTNPNQPAEVTKAYIGKAAAQKFKIVSDEIEKAMVLGGDSVVLTNSANQQPQGITMGLMQYARLRGKTFDALNSGIPAGISALTYTKKWITKCFDELMLLGSSERIAYTSSYVLNFLAEVFAQGTMIMFAPTQTQFGLNFRTLMLTFGNVHFKVHKYMQIGQHSRTILCFSGDNVRIGWLRPMHWKTDPNLRTGLKGDTMKLEGKDEFEEEWLGEWGSYFTNGVTCGVFHNIGLDIPA